MNSKGYIIVRTLLWVSISVMGVVLIPEPIAKALFGLLAVGFVWQGISWYRKAPK